MKIIALEAENIKRLVAVQIKPDGNLVEITGKNGHGKTSVLDCIWWAMAGATHIQSVPIRKGQNTARIRLDLGEMVVTRTFSTTKTGQNATKITVESAKGAKYPSPQNMLDRLLGELSFDPLAFSKSSPKEQFEVVKKFVPGVDFALIEEKNQQDYDKRRDLNRQARGFRDMYAAIPAVDECEKVDEKDLIDLLEKSSQYNSDISKREINRANYRTKIEDFGVETERLIQNREELEEQINKIADRLSEIKEKVTVMSNKLSAAPPLPKPVDISAVRADLDNAKALNEKYEQQQNKQQHLKNSEEIEAEANALTAAIEERNMEKQKAIEAAELPVEGISFGDGEILMDGVPFEQASDAQQLRASVAIAMALNPKLRVIRVRDGSLLDADSMKLLAKMAEKEDYQIWVEKVSDSGKVGIFIEEGEVKYVHGKPQKKEELPITEQI